MAILRIVIVIVLLASFASAQTKTNLAQASPAKPKPTPAAPKAPAAKSSAGEVLEDDPAPPDTPDAIFPTVVARVNSRSIFGQDLQRRIQAQLQTIGSPDWKNLKQDYQQGLIAEGLASLIASELILQRAVALGMKATEAEVQAEFSKMSKTFANDADMNISLASRGMDRNSFTRELRRSLTVERFVNETVGKKISVTPTEVAEYYKGHPDEFKHPDLVRTSHILIMVPAKASAEQDRAALQRAQSLLDRVKKGEDFAKLARENSMDGSASSGGDIGMAPKGTLAPEYESAAFALPVGGVSEPVRTQFGYHIIKVTDKKAAGTASLNEIQSKLTEFLKNQRVEAELQKAVEVMRGSAKIEILIPVPPQFRLGDSTASSPRP
jgi:peptidyl-prolyl cis-trans isomerase C